MSLIDEYKKKAIELFNKEFPHKTKVVYKSKSIYLNGYSLLPEGSSKLMIFEDVASKVLNPYFNSKYPHHPVFKDLNRPLTKENFEGGIKKGFQKIVNPLLLNRDAEAILAGLGLWNGQNLLSYSMEDTYTFLNIKQPIEIPTKVLVTLFTCLGLPNLISEIEKQETIIKIQTESKERNNRIVKARSIVSNGIKCQTVLLISESEVMNIKNDLDELSKILDTIQSYDSYGKLKNIRISEEKLVYSFVAYQHCERIEKLEEISIKLDKLIGYLVVAQSYIHESESLYKDIESAKFLLREVLAKNVDSEYKQFEARLKSLMERYANLYLEQYVKYRLSATDHLKKEHLLQSESKKICDIISESSLIGNSEYKKWLDNINEWKSSDPNLTKGKVLESPYHEFNPREVYNKTLISIHELEESLNIIFEKYISDLRSICKDPSIKSNLDILKTNERKLVEDFREKKIELNLENAIILRNSLIELSKGIEKVEISLDSIKNEWNKPMTIDEFTKSIGEYVDKVCAGKDRKKVRILVR